MSEPDLIIIESVIANPTELYDALRATVAWDERMRSRKTATFGRPYNYSGITYPESPMHPLLRSVVDSVVERAGFRPNNCLLNYYEDGESTMGFHSDSTVELPPGTGIAIVSLGAERSITFQHKRGAKEEFSYLLRGGSLLYMGPEVQQDWRHAVRKVLGADGRISLTFRQIVTAEQYAGADALAAATGG